MVAAEASDCYAGEMSDGKRWWGAERRDRAVADGDEADGAGGMADGANDGRVEDLVEAAAATDGDDLATWQSETRKWGGYVRTRRNLGDLAVNKAVEM